LCGEEVEAAAEEVEVEAAMVLQLPVPPVVLQECRVVL
jgi:hypothetical protein